MLIPTQIEAHALQDPAAALLLARQKTWQGIEILKSKIQPGMRESEAVTLAKSIFAECGADKHWHKPYVRFGKNTLYKFSEQAPTDEILKENDIFFFDFGPVFDGVEGDAGDTFVVGQNPDHVLCAQACRELFERTKQKWKIENLSGRKLYEFATRECELLGYKINLNVTGHRVADFPHQVYTKIRMDELDFKPSSHIWILEFQIRHPHLEFGAFYEDVLF